MIPVSLGILLVPGHVMISEIEASGLIVFHTLIHWVLTVLETGIYPVRGRNMACFTVGNIGAQGDGRPFQDLCDLLIEWQSVSHDSHVTALRG